MTDWTPDRHAAARRACEAATSGPWFHASSRDIDNGSYCVVFQDGDDDITHYVRSFAESDAVPANCRFIARARADLPAALDEIERLQKMVTELATHGDHWTRCGIHFKNTCDCGWSDFVAEAKRAVGGG